jgi:hypothetical protein
MQYTATLGVLNVKLNQMIQSKYLRQADIDDDTVVTIKSVELETMPGDSSEQRWVLYFREKTKGLVANVTALRLLGQLFGDESDNWIGKEDGAFCRSDRLLSRPHCGRFASAAREDEACGSCCSRGRDRVRRRHSVLMVGRYLPVHQRRQAL